MRRSPPGGLARGVQRLLRLFPISQRWFFWGLLFHLAAFLLLAHAYDGEVFRDVSTSLARGEGVYERFASWMGERGDGYYAYPPLYAYMLWVSGRVASALEAGWWVHLVLIKGWMLAADLAVFAALHTLDPKAARTYWTLWFVPIVGIGLVQPDLWVGLVMLMALLLARRDRWGEVGILLALGSGLKFTPLLVAPFVALYLVRWRAPAAVGKLALGILIGSVLVWLPYLAFYRDAGAFGDVIRFHLTRLPSGLTVLAAARSAADALVVGHIVAGNPAPTGVALDTAVAVARRMYPAVTLAALLALLAALWRRPWCLEQCLLLPLLMFFLTTSVVHEQHFLQALPLLLLLTPLRVGSLFWPYTVYVLAAGTPLRFLPPDLGLPVTPYALLPAALLPQAALAVALVLSTGMLVGAVAFSLQIPRIMVRVGRDVPQRAEVWRGW